MRFPYRVRDLKGAQKNFDFLQGKLRSYGFLAYGTGAIAIASGSDTKYGYANEVSDPDDAYDLTNTRYVAKVAGWYEFRGSVSIPAGGAVNTRWILRLYINGASLMNLDVQWATAVWGNDSFLKGYSGWVRLNAGDTVDMRVNQNSGAGLNIGNVGATTSFSGGLVGLI